MAHKITLFELHFDGVNFGSAPAGSTDEPAPSTEYEDATDDEGGRSVGKLVLGMVLTSVAVSVVASRLAKRFAGEESSTDVEFEAPEDAAEATV